MASTIFKNTASQKWRVYAYNATTGLAVTGDAANITASIEKDYGAAAATNDVNPAEEGGGYYDFDLTQAETNANHLALRPVSSTANVVVLGSPASMLTTPPNHPAMLIAGAGQVTSNQTHLNGVPVTYPMPSNVTQLGGDAQSATDLKDFADAGYDPGTNKVEGVKVNDDMRGTDDALPAASAPANFGDLYISPVQGRVDVALIEGADASAVIRVQVDDALVAIHLDHLLAVATTTFPGNTGSILGELLERPTTWRYVAEALSQAPGGTTGGSSRVVTVGPAEMEVPDSGTTTFRLWTYVYDVDGASSNADSTPTITVHNQAGTDRSANFNGTVQNPAVGVYYQDYDVASTHPLEQLHFEWTVVEAGETIRAATTSYVVDEVGGIVQADVVRWDGDPSAVKRGATSNLPQVDVEAVSDSPPAAANLQDFAEAGYDAVAKKVEGVKVVDLSTSTGDMRGTDGAFTGTEATIAAAIRDMVVETEGTYTLQQVLSIALAVLAGETSDAGATLKSPNGIATRVAAIINASNERTSVTVTPSGP